MTAFDPFAADVAKTERNPSCIILEHVNFLGGFGGIGNCQLFPFSFAVFGEVAWRGQSKTRNLADTQSPRSASLVAIFIKKDYACHAPPIDCRILAEARKRFATLNTAAIN